MCSTDGRVRIQALISFLGRGYRLGGDEKAKGFPTAGLVFLDPRPGRFRRALIKRGATVTTGREQFGTDSVCLELLCRPSSQSRTPSPTRSGCPGATTPRRVAGTARLRRFRLASLAAYPRDPPSAAGLSSAHLSRLLRLRRVPPGAEWRAIAVTLASSSRSCRDDRNSPCALRPAVGAGRTRFACYQPPSARRL